MSSGPASDRKIQVDDVIEITQRYRIAGLVHTNLGRAYRARDEFLGRDVLLTILTSEFSNRPLMRSRFLLEGWITGNLEHPSIVALYSLGESERLGAFYVTPLRSDNSLRSLLGSYHNEVAMKQNRAERRLAFGRLLQHFINVCHAIAFAHDRGVIHCDIKPDSVTVGKFGETFVGNWDLGRLLDGSRLGETEGGSRVRRHHESLTIPMVADRTVGTPAYMSPEQAAGRPDWAGQASDVFSLGATLYEILTGIPPYKGTPTVEVLASAQKCEYRRPRKVNRMVPQALEAICMKAMARQPEDRYASAMALAEEVERWLAATPVLASRRTLLGALLNWARFKRRESSPSSSASD